MTNPNNQPVGNNKTTGAPQFISNNLNKITSFTQTLVVDANGAASNLLLFQGPSPIWLGTKLGCTVPDQNHITLSSSISAGNANGLAEMNLYLRQVGLHIKSVTMQTNQTSLYDSNLYFLELDPNGYPVPEKLMLSVYAQVLGGGGYDRNLKISDHPFSTAKNFAMYIDNVPASSTTTITYDVDYISKDLVGVSNN